MTTTLTLNGKEFKLYKILNKGRTYQMGYEFPLPIQQEDGSWEPGAWCKEEEAELKQRGFHATTDPIRYCEERIPEIYECEVDQVGDTKYDLVVAKRCRLLRPAKQDDLFGLHILLTPSPTNGFYTLEGEDWITYGSVVARAFKNAMVEAHNSVKVIAEDVSFVSARDQVDVELYGAAKVEARDDVTVRAYGDATRVRAENNAKVHAWNGTRVEAFGSAVVYAYNSTEVSAGDEVEVFAHDNAWVVAYDKSVIHVYSKGCAINVEGPDVRVIHHESEY